MDNVTITTSVIQSALGHRAFLYAGIASIDYIPYIQCTISQYPLWHVKSYCDALSRYIRRKYAEHGIRVQHIDFRGKQRNVKENRCA